MLLFLIFTIGVVVSAIATSFDLKTTLNCNPDKIPASDLKTWKYIESQCLLKYAQEFHPSLPLYVLIIINFGLVILLSFIYAWLAKDHVEIYADPPSTTTNGVEGDSQSLLTDISQAAYDPKLYRGNSGRSILFIVYIMHLIICRIIPLMVFAIFILSTASNFPINFHCPWPNVKTTSLPLANLSQPQKINSSFVDCTYPVGNNKENVGNTVVAVNFLIVVVAFAELVYLLWSAWKDPNLSTDIEFCSAYILGKRVRIGELLKRIKKDVSDEVFNLSVNSREKRKLKDIYINVIMQEGRECYSNSNGRYKDRHETYQTHLKKPPDAIILKRMEDLFKPMAKDQPRTILVVGRPGIGKTLLTKKILYQWKQQTFWHEKIVIVTRFRNFNKNSGITSLREILRHPSGLKMSPTDFNALYEYISLMPSKVVLIFDGLDEVKHSDVLFAEEEVVYGHNESAHILVIFKQLVNGDLLPGATVLATSRPTADNTYGRMHFDRVVEILGFHEEQIYDYVKKFCSENVQKRVEIWNQIIMSPELLSLCYVPVNSYIVCLTLEESIRVKDQMKIPKTITELYKRALKILLYRHHLSFKDKEIPKDYLITKLPEELQNDLNKLKKIARDGMIKDKLTFESRTNDTSDKSIGELSDCGLFDKPDDEEQNIFCFLHLTIQEFLTALDVVDDITKIDEFLCKYIGNPKWHLVIQFVAGLIGNKFRDMQNERSRLERLVSLLLAFSKEIIKEPCLLKKTSRLIAARLYTVSREIVN